MLDSFLYPNGLRVVVDTNKNVKTVCVGVWIGSGSKNESDTQNGIAHFTEHMLFKGTPNLNPFEIADRFERVGAQVNAFTGKEYTCYYFKSVDDAAQDCFDTLSQIFFKSDYKQTELDKERNVIIEEINMVEDSPEDLCFDLIAKLNFGSGKLANTILGPISNVSRFQKEDIIDYTSHNYTPNNIVVAAAGNIDLQQIDKLINQYFLPNLGNQKPTRPTVDCTYMPATASKLIKDFEQSNIIMSYKSIPYNDKQMYTQSILNVVLGGGMSSRLFQKVREENGLCYSIYTTPLYYDQLGSFNVVCNNTPSNTGKVIDLITSEIDLLCQKGITPSEFDRAKAQLKAAFVYSQESIQSCMNNAGKLMVSTGEVFDYQKRLQQMESVTMSDFTTFCNQILKNQKPTIAYVGKEIDIDLHKYTNNI